jgi:prepilin-type N-terminal cleavage/methylation domain-containing protein
MTLRTGEQARGNRLRRKFFPGFSASFTMTELLIVLAIIAVLSITAIPAFVDFLGHNKLKNASLEIAAVFKTARQLAITNRKNYKVIINDVDDTTNNLYYAVKIYQDSDGTIENWRQLATTVELYTTFPLALDQTLPYPDDDDSTQDRPAFEFYPDGHVGSASQSFGIREKAKQTNTRVITIYNTTGGVKIQ